MHYIIWWDPDVGELGCEVLSPAVAKVHAAHRAHARLAVHMRGATRRALLTESLLRLAHVCREVHLGRVIRVAFSKLLVAQFATADAPGGALVLRPE
jgi:hypothetical protein